MDDFYFKIRYILEDFYTDKNNLPENVDDDAEDNFYIKYIQLIKLAVENDSFYDIMTVEKFAECCEKGYMNDYDGFGYYLNWNGNKISLVCTDDTKAEWPEGAEFVAWFNK